MLKSLVWILIIFILGVAGYTGWIFYNQDQIMQIKRNPKDISLVWVRDQDLVMGKCEGAKIEHVFFEPNPAFVYFASQKPEQCFIFKLQDPILYYLNKDKKTQILGEYIKLGEKLANTDDLNKIMDSSYETVENATKLKLDYDVKNTTEYAKIETNYYADYIKGVKPFLRENIEKYETQMGAFSVGEDPFESKSLMATIENDKAVDIYVPPLQETDKFRKVIKKDYKQDLFNYLDKYAPKN